MISDKNFLYYQIYSVMCLKCTQEYGAEKTKYDVRYINNVCFYLFDVL